MKTTNTQVTIQTSELAALLNIISAKSVFGLDTTSFSPPNVEARENFIAEGIAALKENGWLLQAEPGKFNLNPNLIFMVAIMADPEIVISTTRYLNSAEKQVLLHYLVENYIVEQVFTTEGHYQLTNLLSHTAIVQHINAMLAESDQPSYSLAPSKIFEIKAEVLTQVRQLIVQNQIVQAQFELKGRGWSDTDIDYFLGWLSNSKMVAEIEIGRTIGAELLAWHNFIIFEAEDSFWTFQDDGVSGTSLILQPTSLTDFAQQLAKVVLKFYEIQPEPIAEIY